ncbi:lytic transglycosylase [Thiohalomonas denitrificans]|uniref:Membrane-bound lytic murein transglycosylase D n=1 Tax=Thiohalomonas denitrificans TaxID=415747 RepID=A0A1G5QP88_9GAMM|nr:LysM peptidoglycan-binding domain-containing protein [Thiohalomonas denitrificans]SCZ63552.1 membrane-bound lytic murein transglycosylase D [Thiohalomonas denitrificans]
MPKPIKQSFLRVLSLSWLPLTLSGCLLQQALTETAEPETREPVTTSTSGSGQPTPVAPEPVHVSLESTTQAAESLPEPAGPPENLWDRLRSGYRLPAIEHAHIDADINWYASHQSYLDRVAERAEPYLHMVVESIEERDMPTEIALLPVVESAFQPFAYSHGRAAGLWQFVPATGHRFGLQQNWWYDGRRDVAEATRAALDYLEFLHQKFDGDWLLALAAYNSGEGTVGKAIRRNRQQGKPIDFFSLNLPDETRGYVPRLLAISRVVADPERHGVTLKPISNTPYLARVDVGSQIDLDLVAELAELPIEDVYRYNPGFNRWATAPDGPHKLLLPLEKSESFLAKLKDYPANERLTWTRHRIRSGENLGKIAQHYKTTVNLIQQVNDLNSHTIRAGQSLVIPVARKDLDRYNLSADQRLAKLQDKDREGKKIKHHVQNGDTLWDIARSYGVSVRTLAKWNGMAPRDLLRPGQTLTLWTRNQQQQASNANPVNFAHPFEKSTRQRIGYTVRSGDSLSRISQRFRVSVDNLKRWNNLQGKKYLQPGQSLTLYVDVTKQADSI